MTFQLGEVLQALITAGLLGTAGVLWRTVIKLAELGVEVRNQDRRLDRLERVAPVSCPLNPAHRPE